MKNIIYLTFVYFLVAGCKENDPNFDFKPLSDFEYQPANINEGTTVQILSFSGGPVCTNKATYYYQYIGIVKGTQDTIRILSPCQEIPEGHRLTEGNFSPWEKSSEIIDKVLKDHGERSFESENKLVVFNKQNPELIAFLILLVTACQDKRKGNDTLILDDVRININSAGIGYHVVEESKLDSSNGLNYIVALSVTNEGKAPVSFNEESFTLFNSKGEKMPSKTDFGVPSAAINLNAITTTIGPDETKEIMLIFTVKEHGVYRFQIVSPTTGIQKWVDLPSS